MQLYVIMNIYEISAIKQIASTYDLMLVCKIRIDKVIIK